jgi:carbonic anhydrase
MLALLLILKGWAWDYDKLGRDWTGLCADGEKQSPVRINTQLVHLVENGSDEDFFVELEYREVEVRNSNSSSLHGVNYLPGKNFHVFADFGQARIDNKVFKARYIKFHSPSEHQVDSSPFPLELQIVHWSSNQTLIISLFFSYSSDSNKFLSDLIDSYSSVGGHKVRLNDVLGGWFAIKDFWSYEGSLTEPPCNEQVLYIISHSPVPATISQITFFKSILQSNSREWMPLNSRKVKSFKGLQDSFSRTLLLTLLCFLI